MLPAGRVRHLLPASFHEPFARSSASTAIPLTRVLQPRASAADPPRYRAGALHVEQETAREIATDPHGSWPANVARASSKGRGLRSTGRSVRSWIAHARGAVAALEAARSSAYQHADGARPADGVLRTVEPSTGRRRVDDHAKGVERSVDGPSAKPIFLGHDRIPKRVRVVALVAEQLVQGAVLRHLGPNARVPPRNSRPLCAARVSKPFEHGLIVRCPLLALREGQVLRALQPLDQALAKSSRDLEFLDQEVVLAGGIGREVVELRLLPSGAASRWIARSGAGCP